MKWDLPRQGGSGTGHERSGRGGGGQPRRSGRDGSAAAVALREPGGDPFGWIDTTAVLPAEVRSSQDPHLPRSSNYLPTSASPPKLSLIGKPAIDLMRPFSFFFFFARLTLPW